MHFGLHFSVLAGPHPRSLALGDFAPRAGRRRCCLCLCLLVLLTSHPTGQPASSDQELRLRIEQIRQAPTTPLHGARLRRPAAVARFFEARSFAPAWQLPRGAQDVLTAIRGIDADGLDPTHYHLGAITSALDLYSRAPSKDLAAELQVLVADAAAALADHVQYGKVSPSALDRRWNVDPRVGAPPLETTLDGIARAGSVGAGIDALKPKHFIYLGLKQALSRMRGLAAAGGWPAIPPGPAIKPGAKDPRIAIVRKRLKVTGELVSQTAPVDELVHDADLQSAVKNFQSHHRLTDDGVIGRATMEALSVSADARASQLRVNLERARWVVGGLRDTFLLVNLPAYKAYVIRDRRNIWETRAQIGRAARQTPAFRADMTYVVLNPDWTVPPTILAEDVLAGMRKGQNTIAKKKLTIRDEHGRAVDPASIDWQSATRQNFRYTLRQPPGPDNALGRVKFIFPNEYSIFLHDTPSQELFAADQRTFSSGCIRVENALDLARVLLEGQSVRSAPSETWTPERIQQVIASKQSQTVFLDTPLQVLIVYWTASVGASGEVRFAKDAYGRDPAVLRALAR
jgi:murein L,D-transpeptidase YcbB/YkuD